MEWSALLQLRITQGCLIEPTWVHLGICTGFNPVEKICTILPYTLLVYLDFESKHL